MAELTGTDSMPTESWLGGTSSVSLVNSWEALRLAAFASMLGGKSPHMSWPCLHTILNRVKNRMWLMTYTPKLIAKSGALAICTSSCIWWGWRMSWCSWQTRSGRSVSGLQSRAKAHLVLPAPSGDTEALSSTFPIRLQYDRMKLSCELKPDNSRMNSRCVHEPDKSDTKSAVDRRNEVLSGVVLTAADLQPISIQISRSNFPLRPTLPATLPVAAAAEFGANYYFRHISFILRLQQQNTKPNASKMRILEEANSTWGDNKWFSSNRLHPCTKGLVGNGVERDAFFILWTKKT